MKSRPFGGHFDTLLHVGFTSITLMNLSFSELPIDVLVTRIFSCEFLPDPADLARLQVVSRSMREVVRKVGRVVRELAADEAADLAVYHNCVSGLYRLDRRDRLFGFLCVDAEQCVYQRFFEQHKWDLPTMLSKLEHCQSQWSVEVIHALKIIVTLPGHDNITKNVAD